MENKGKRLADAIDYLKQNGVVNNLEDVAEKVDRSKNNISSAINGDKRYLSNKFLKHFNACFNNIFSFDWLANGIGTMLNNCGCSSADDESIYHPSSDGTCNGTGTEEEGRKSESEQARFYKEQAEFYKEQAEFYKQQLDSLKGRQ